VHCKVYNIHHRNVFRSGMYFIELERVFSLFNVLYFLNIIVRIFLTKYSKLIILDITYIGSFPFIQLLKKIDITGKK
jgi:hypothetical protein